MSSDPPPFNEDDLYDQFPDSAAAGYGPAQGFNDWRQINDKDLFTDEALEDPVIQAFVNAPITVTYAQFKSSFRESEYFIHKPHRAMSGGVTGINGGVRVRQGRRRSSDADRHLRDQSRADSRVP